MPEPYRAPRRFCLRITWHGHSCFEISDSINLVVDPHDGYSLGLRKPESEADVVMVSHDHFDHNCTDVVAGPDAIIVNEPGARTVRDIDIRGFEAFHDKKKGRIRGKVVMFRITVEGIRCLHVGDLGHVLDSKDVENLGGIDILFVPVGGTFTMDSKDAVELMKLIDPIVTIPMHYHIPGLSLAIDPVSQFLTRSGLPVLKVGDAIDFIAEDLPDHREIWLFDY